MGSSVWPTSVLPQRLRLKGQRSHFRHESSLLRERGRAALTGRPDRIQGGCRRPTSRTRGSTRGAASKVSLLQANVSFLRVPEHGVAKECVDPLSSYAKPTALQALSAADGRAQVCALAERMHETYRPTSTVGGRHCCPGVRGNHPASIVEVVGLVVPCPGVFMMAYLPAGPGGRVRNGLRPTLLPETLERVPRGTPG